MVGVKFLKSSGGGGEMFEKSHDSIGDLCKFSEKQRAGGGGGWGGGSPPPDFEKVMIQLGVHVNLFLMMIEQVMFQLRVHVNRRKISTKLGGGCGGLG